MSESEEDREYRDFRPRLYSVEVDIGPNDGDKAKGSVVVDTRPFLIEYVKHQIVNDGRWPAKPDQDGLYRIDWSISEQQRYFSGPVPMADTAFGTSRTGVWKPLSPPLLIRSTLVLNVTVYNAWGPRPADFRVQVQFDGHEKHAQTMGPRE